MTRSIQHRITLCVCPCCISSSVGCRTVIQQVGGGSTQSVWFSFARKVGDTSFRLEASSWRSASNVSQMVADSEARHELWQMKSQTTMNQSDTSITRKSIQIQNKALRPESIGLPLPGTDVRNSELAAVFGCGARQCPTTRQAVTEDPSLGFLEPRQILRPCHDISHLWAVHYGSWIVCQQCYWEWIQ
jgi:hypothetical protein